MSEMMRTISLGWGVQSFTLAVMAALGDLDPVDLAIHADTTHEAGGTYAHAEKWTPWLEERGVKVITVNDAQQAAAVETFKTDIPAFTLTDNGGMLRRQCTNRWKIKPMRRWLQRHRNGRQVESWLGITVDEAQRMRPSDVQYIRHRWPLIEKRMSRHDCQLYLQRLGIDIPPKSACVFCPYHNLAAWRDLKMNGGPDWQKAVNVDRAIRKVRPPFDLFVHPARIPLEEVDMRNEEDRGQLSMFDEECFGVCGI